MESSPTIRRTGHRGSVRSPSVHTSRSTLRSGPPGLDAEIRESHALLQTPRESRPTHSAGGRRPTAARRGSSRAARERFAASTGLARRAQEERNLNEKSSAPIIGRPAGSSPQSSLSQPASDASLDEIKGPMVERIRGARSPPSVVTLVGSRMIGCCGTVSAPPVSEMPSSPRQAGLAHGRPIG
jgi:hypothetical protein